MKNVLYSCDKNKDEIPKKRKINKNIDYKRYKLNEKKYIIEWQNLKFILFIVFNNCLPFLGIFFFVRRIDMICYSIDNFFLRLIKDALSKGLIYYM